VGLSFFPCRSLLNLRAIRVAFPDSSLSPVCFSVAYPPQDAPFYFFFFFFLDDGISPPLPGFRSRVEGYPKPRDGFLSVRFYCSAPYFNLPFPPFFFRSLYSHCCALSGFEIRKNFVCIFLRAENCQKISAFPPLPTDD